MKVKLKKNCNVKEHGLMGRAGDEIHVAINEAQNLLKHGLVTAEGVPAIIEKVESAITETVEDVAVETLSIPDEPKARKPRKKKSE